MKFRDKCKEAIKAYVYKNRLLGRLAAPTYPFCQDPSQLAWLIQAAQKTRGLKGDIVEIGVARGMTTVFMNTYLKGISDKRRYVCIDTFGGFTEKDVAYEVEHRGKNEGDYIGFAYNDEGVFTRNMERFGWDDIITIACDVNKYDFSDINEISLALIDIDLYLPTKTALDAVWKRLQQGGAIMVDDVQSQGVFDGAGVAYREFCKAYSIIGELLPTEGAVLWKGNANVSS